MKNLTKEDEKKRIILTMDVGGRHRIFFRRCEHNRFKYFSKRLIVIKK